jgi:hypothetical protein
MLKDVAVVYLKVVWQNTPGGIHESNEKPWPGYWASGTGVESSIFQIQSTDISRDNVQIHDEAHVGAENLLVLPDGLYWTH